MLVIKIDHADAEAPETLIASRSDVLGPAVDSPRSIRPDVTELCGDNEPFTPVFDRLPHQLLVVAPSIHIGSVQKIDSEPDGSLNRCDRLDVVARSVECRHPHAAQSDGRDHRTFEAQLTFFHFHVPPGMLHFIGTRFLHAWFRNVLLESCQILGTFPLKESGTLPQ